VVEAYKRDGVEFIDSGDVTLNIDYKQMGVGGDDSWGALPHPEYTLPAGDYEYSFRINMFKSDLEDESVIIKRRFDE